ncbi:MAG: copper amine oxidase N-terminal domain-containing protein [Defluviitaleaceae bacterium]|nr:copper amine oxidase N-terminal domain-containing protein [Defluviitaleaceae bacterium]
MKGIIKFIGLGFLLTTLVFALAACSDGVAPLAAPEDEGIIYVDTDYAEFEEDEVSELDLLDMTEGSIFGNVTGEIVSIDEAIEMGGQRIQIEGEDGATVLMTHFNTFTLGRAPEVGDTITGFFILEPFMMAIYPPQHTATVIVNNDDVQEDGIPFIHVDRFFTHFDSDQLISADGELVINIGADTTEVTLQSGDAFEGDFAGRMLLVTYAMSTRSLPPQTTPIQIVVLYEMPVTGPEFVELPDDWEVEDVEPWYCIVVDGEGLVGPLALFMDEEMDFQTHVELMPVAEHLGAYVNWDQDTNIVTLEGRIGSISFEVGSYEFIVDGETVALYHSSVDFYGTVFVPVLFFRDVFGMPAAYAFEGRIYISSTESDMQ